MSPVDSDVLLVGLVDTGKTSYLALLYTAIEAGKAGSLSLGAYDDDREYVHQIADRLARGEVAVHTPYDDQDDQERLLHLNLTFAGSPHVLRIPDLSGETWGHALADRHWSSDVDDAVARSSGVLLFLSADPEKFEDGRTIGTEIAGANALGGTENSDAPPPGVPGAAMPTGSEDEDLAITAGGLRTQSTQVALVDLVQLLVSRRDQRSHRVAIVLSSWDKRPEQTTPEQWVRMNCPLLDQYLECNRPWLESRVFGVSAQGGDLLDEEVRAALLPLDAVERSLVERADGTVGSVEEPLTWMLQGS